MDELKKDLHTHLSFFDSIFSFTKTKTDDYVDDAKFDRVADVLEFGLHRILWYVIQVALVFLFAFIVWRHISIQTLLYTVIIFFILKFGFQKLTGK